MLQYYKHNEQNIKGLGGFIVSPFWIAMIVIIVILVVACIVFYFLGKKAEKKQAEQQEQLDAVAQPSVC